MTLAAQAASAPFLPGRNRIINGSCRVANLPVLTQTTVSSGYGGPNRWKMNFGAASGSISQSQQTLTYNGGPLACVQQLINTGIVQNLSSHSMSGLRQRIEGYNAYDLVGQPISVSFLILTNWTGVCSAALVDGAGANSFVYPFNVTAGVIQRVTFTAPANQSLNITRSTAAGLDLYIGATANAANATVTSTLNQWVAAGASVANTATAWMATAGNYIQATNIQVEAGPVATPFDLLSTTLEIALTQRYYVSGLYSSYRGYNVAAANMIQVIQLPVVMRTTPTVAWGTAPTQNNCSASVSSANATTMQVTASVTATGDAYWVNGLVNLDAEL